MWERHWEGRNARGEWKCRYIAWLIEEQKNDLKTLEMKF